MLKNIKEKLKKKFYQIRSFLIAKIGNNFLYLLIKTCRLQIVGLDLYRELIEKEKCILMLWHNRLAPVPFILSQYTPQTRYAALISGSRDGDILKHIAHSYKNGSTIQVPHLARYQALQNIIRHVNERKTIVIMTPDGPRGPRYELKPGIAIAALQTQAHVISLNWEAKSYWEFKTWDRFRLPKPFTSIQVTFSPSICFDKAPQPSLEKARALLSETLPNGN